MYHRSRSGDDAARCVSVQAFLPNNHELWINDDDDTLGGTQNAYNPRCYQLVLVNWTARFSTSSQSTELETIMMISWLGLRVRFKNSWGTSARISGDRALDTHQHFCSIRALFLSPLAAFLALFCDCDLLDNGWLFYRTHFLVTLWFRRGVSNFPLPWCSSLALLLFRFSIDLLHLFVSFCWN